MLGKGPPDVLARVERAGSRVYGEARRLQYAFVRRNWRWLGVIAIVAMLPNVLSLVVGTSFQRGLLLGFTGSGTLALLAWLVVMYSGTAPTLMGAGAERWTAEEIEDLERHGYRIVHNAGLRPGDIDHVLVGPAGVFALETKWRSGSWSDLGLASARRQVESNAHVLRLVTKRFGVHRVVPVVVAWGPTARELGAPPLSSLPAEGSATVMHGIELKRWLLSLAGGVLTAEQVEQVRAEVAAHARRRDQREPPPPISLMDAGVALWRVIVGVMVAVLLALPLGPLPELARLAVVLAALAITFGARRMDRWRVAGTAALTIEAVWLLFVLIDLGS